jgi:hypothetical protein
MYGHETRTLYTSIDPVLQLPGADPEARRKVKS